jgi:hypothetical protein
MNMRTPITLALLLIPLAARAADNAVLVEAESFKDYGGWVCDTQFVHIMGSPYLLAHGMGRPVKDASTAVELPEAGQWHVYVRTMDWVARWKAPGQPGRFQVLIDGRPLSTTFGTEGADWHWQDGGVIEIKNKQATLGLHDLTGFEGRCDAIAFCRGDTAPPGDAKPLAAWRKQVLGLSDQPRDAGEFDLVVVGGGYGGLGAAISGARMGCRVALIQDRPVLGGNGSSEVRVWSQGGTTLGKYPHLGEIVEEFSENAKGSPGPAESFEDAKKEAIVRSERNITLFFNIQAYAVEMKDGSIAAVLAREIPTSAEIRFRARLVADTTGHGTIGALAGAEFDMAEKGHMGMSNMWVWSEATSPQAFPETPWALPLTMKDFPYPNRGKGEWFWEGGFNRDPITELEYVRDWNFRAVYGAFNAMKNGDGKDKHVNARLDWIAHVGGTRESRLLRGDLVLTREDIVNQVDYPDGCVPTTWSIDLHVPKEQYEQKFPDDPFISKAIFDARVDKQNGYPVPYRCFYSKNIPNLFMAGRDISVDRGALGTIRVMRTGGMMGEVVGKAASICTKYHCTPRDVYQTHFEELRELMQLPGRARRAGVNDKPDPNAPLPEASRNPAPPHRADGGSSGPGTDPQTLPGIIIDDSKAKLTGQWKRSSYSPGYIGAGYIHDDNSGKGTKSARYEFTVPQTGQYEVRFSYRGGDSRADNVPVTIITADGERTIHVDEKKTPELPGGFVSLGNFRFDSTKPAAVVVSNKDTKGHVIADAVQVLPAK